MEYGVAAHITIITIVVTIYINKSYKLETQLPNSLKTPIKLIDIHLQPPTSFNNNPISNRSNIREPRTLKQLPDSITLNISIVIDTSHDKVNQRPQSEDIIFIPRQMFLVFAAWMAESGF